jgi:sodium-dependent phosphate cotransporter
MTGFLAKLSHTLAGVVGTGGGGTYPNPLKVAAKAVVNPVRDAIYGVIPGEQLASLVMVLVSMGVIFLALYYLVKLLRNAAASRVQVYMTRALDASPYIAMLVGMVMTVIVQSSSITTSLMVPLAGARIVTLRQIFPVTLGSNLGTTVTALLASMAAPQETAALAVQIALVHLIFNLTGIALIFTVPAIREIPLRAARGLANLAVRSKKLAILYLVSLFYALPALLVVATRAW